MCADDRQRRADHIAHEGHQDAEDNEAGGDPGGSLTELEQARAGGQQADDGVEQEVGDLAGAGDLAERGDGGDQGDDGDEQNGSGRFNLASLICSPSCSKIACVCGSTATLFRPILHTTSTSSLCSLL